MNFFIENCYCWLRNKDTTKAKIFVKPTNNLQMQQQLFCAGCFKYITSFNEFTQITKIGSKYYGICSDECYDTWLKTPATQCLSPINDYATLSRLRDNQR